MASRGKTQEILTAETPPDTKKGPEEIEIDYSTGQEDQIGTEEAGKGVIEEKAQETSGEETDFKPISKLPKPIAKVVSSPQHVWDYMNALQEGGWFEKGCLWYLYRHGYPVLKRPEGEKNIDKGARPINTQYLYDEHGSGDYGIIITQTGLGKGGDKLMVGKIQLRDPAYPPKFRIQDLDVNDKANKNFVEQAQREGKLDMNGMVVSPIGQQGMTGDALIPLLMRLIDKLDSRQLQQAQAKDPTEPAISRAFDIMAQGNKASIEMLLAQMKQDSPESLIKLMTSITALVNPQGKDDTAVWQLLLKTQNESHERTMQLMQQMMNMQLESIKREVAARPTEKDEEDEDEKFEKKLERFARIGEMFGGGAGGGGGKKSTLEVVLNSPAVVQVGNIISGLVQLGVARAQRGQVVNGQEQQHTQTVQQHTSTGEVAGTAAIPGATDTTASNQNIEEMTPEQQQAQAAMNIKALITHGMVKQAILTGVEGDAFAESLENLFGQDGKKTYTQIASLGPQGIVEVMKSDAKFWADFVTMEARVVKFTEDFVAYGTDEGVGENEEAKG